MRRSPLVLTSLALVMSACGGGEVSTDATTSIPIAPTTTSAPVATSTTVLATTTTVSAVANLSIAEAASTAIYDGDVAALDDLPWSSQSAKQDALDIARFEAALNVNVLGSSCDGESARIVVCQVRATDDLSDALGIVGFEDNQEFRFDDSGKITLLISEAQDGGVGEVFTNWAWGIAYPGICEAPAQCAAALLGVVDEYNETYAGAVVASYIAAYNQGDIDRVMDLFTEESVITGHPAAVASVSGLPEIRSLHMKDIAAAATDNAYTISNIEVSEDTVTWDHVWVNDEREEFCKLGHEAVIEDGKFISWTWPDGGFDCP